MIPDHSARPLTDLLSLVGRRAVVTGGARGIGAAIVARLAEAGADVIAADLDLVAAQGWAAEVTSRGTGRVIAASVDVADSATLARVADQCVTELGGLDIWVLTGCFFGIKAAAEVMIPQGRGGRIVNIASQAAKSGFPHAQAYTASKHGLVGLTRSAAIELGQHRITVNNVCPNHVTTGLGAWQNEYFSKVVGAPSVEAYLKAMAERIPLKRPGLAEDTAKAVAFLCSVDADYITAESMNVSGGEEPH